MEVNYGLCVDCSKYNYSVSSMDLTSDDFCSMDFNGEDLRSMDFCRDDFRSTDLCGEDLRMLDEEYSLSYSNYFISLCKIGDPAPGI